MKLEGLEPAFSLSVAAVTLHAEAVRKKLVIFFDSLVVKITEFRKKIFACG